MTNCKYFDRKFDFFHNSVFFKKKADNSLKKSKVEWHWYFFILSLHLQFIDFIHLRHCFYRFISICFHFQKQKSKDTRMAFFFFRFWNKPIYIFLNARHDNLEWTKPSTCVVKISNHLFDTKFDVYIFIVPIQARVTHSAQPVARHH